MVEDVLGYRIAQRLETDEARPAYDARKAAQNTARGRAGDADNRDASLSMAA
jgi:hypothetical protein